MEEEKVLVDPCENCPQNANAFNLAAGDGCDYENDPCQEKLQYMNAMAELQDKIDEASKRTHTILVIKRKRSFDPAEDDDSKVELNEGYEFEADAPIPEIADGIAKMAIEMDKMPELDKDSGMMFLTLIAQFYKKLKEGGE